jgi:hypothetical protein
MLFAYVIFVFASGHSRVYNTKLVHILPVYVVFLGKAKK